MIILVIIMNLLRAAIEKIDLFSKANNLWNDPNKKSKLNVGK
jgi:hypothetical protein